MDEATRISLKDQFNSLLVRAIEGRRGGMALMRVLEELDFYNSPASAKHHLNVPGGLVLHSLNVARAALELCDKMPQFAKCNGVETAGQSIFRSGPAQKAYRSYPRPWRSTRRRNII